VYELFDQREVRGGRPLLVTGVRRAAGGADRNLARTAASGRTNRLAAVA